MLMTLALASTLTTTQPPPRHWYGWQILLADVGSVAAIAGGGLIAATSRDDGAVGGSVMLAGLGLVGYFALPPAIHGANDNSKVALPSFAWRAALTVGTALPTYAVVRILFGKCVNTNAESYAHCEDTREQIPPVFASWALMIGVVVATTLDVTTFAWGPVPSAKVVPSFDPMARSAGVSLVGQF